MLKKLAEKYTRRVLEINASKTDYSVVDGRSQDVDLGTKIIAAKSNFLYLGVTVILVCDSDANQEMKSRMGQQK